MRVEVKDVNGNVLDFNVTSSAASLQACEPLASTFMYELAGHGITSLTESKYPNPGPVEHSYQLTSQLRFNDICNSMIGFHFLSQIKY